MMKTTENGLLGQKMISRGQKNAEMPAENPMDFFVKGLRMLKSSNAESFSLAGEGHCIGGRFPMKLPSSFCLKDCSFSSCC